MSDLIDTTEMYLRTIYELEEEGVVPLRARIAERLGQSGPTVSQTVARMERDRLLTVEGDRHLELTTEGRALATRDEAHPRLRLERVQSPAKSARTRQGSIKRRLEMGRRARCHRAGAAAFRWLVTRDRFGSTYA